MIDFLFAVLSTCTPLVYVTIAGLLSQRVGVWNLGLEGNMIFGACASVIGVIETGSFLSGLLIACFACMIFSLLMWFTVEVLKSNQIISGLALTGIGIASTSLTLQAMYGSEASITAPFGIPLANQIFPNFIYNDSSFGQLSLLVLVLPLLVFLVWFILQRTRFGLQLTATGEHPFAARSVGISTRMMRLWALLASGFFCALGGSQLALGSLNLFAQDMTAGRGFMAFSAVIFGNAQLLGSVIAALLFSIIEVVGIKVQLVFGDMIAPDLLLSLPYIFTIFALWISGRFNGKSKRHGISELKDI